MIDLTVPQTLFTQAQHVKYPLFVAGFGSGKSTCLGVNIMNDLGYPGANVGTYAPTYDLLNLIIVPYMEEFLEMGDIPYKYNKQEHIFYVEDHGQIICRSLDNPRRIVGYQVFRSHIDELDTVGEKNAREAWNKVIARNRQKIYMVDDKGNRIPNGTRPDGSIKYKTHLNRVSAYTTPEGFGFCYKRWEKEPARGYEMFRASTFSNPHLPDDYIQSLMDSYPEELINAYVHGIFTNLTSGACYPKFSRTANHSDVEPIDGEDIHIGMDFNVMVGAAVYHVLRNDYPIAIDENVKAYDTDEQIAAIKDKYPKSVANRGIFIYPDASGTHRTSSNTVETDIAKLESAGFHVIYDYSNPAIKDRVFSLSAMICNAAGERRYKINTKRCPHTTDCLEQQVWGDNGLPDKKAGIDHHPDSVGYYIWQKFPLIKQSANVTIVRGRY